MVGQRQRLDRMRRSVNKICIRDSVVVRGRNIDNKIYKKVGE